MERVDAADMLAFLIEQKGITQSALAEAVGASEPTISLILAGKRKPGRALMAAFGEYFHVDPGVFL
jgi:HTH-type transcriptional regulator/antitoxin HigA